MPLKNWPEIPLTAARENQVEYVVSQSFADRENLEEISLLEELSFTTPWKRESLEIELYNPLNLTTVINRPPAAKIAGYSLTRILPPEAELLRIAVRPEYRSRGVGRRLLDALVQELSKLNVTRIYLEVSAKNRTALYLYRQFGFIETGRRPNYYDNSTTDAVNFVLSVP